MQSQTITEMFKAACSDDEGGAFGFAEQVQASVLIAAGGALLTVDRVVRAAVRGELVELESGRGERTLVAAESVVAVQLQHGDDATGFLKA